ncbi:MAG: hypothetical protein AAF441_09665 [Pseudomonadota bacterium]
MSTPPWTDLAFLIGLSEIVQNGADMTGFNPKFSPQVHDTGKLRRRAAFTSLHEQI